MPQAKFIVRSTLGKPNPTHGAWEIGDAINEGELTEAMANDLLRAHIIEIHPDSVREEQLAAQKAELSAEIGQELEQVKAQLQTANDDNAALKKRLEDSASELKTAREAIAPFKKRNDELADQVKELQNQLKAKKGAAPADPVTPPAVTPPAPVVTGNEPNNQGSGTPPSKEGAPTQEQVKSEAGAPGGAEVKPNSTDTVNPPKP